MFGNNVDLSSLTDAVDSFNTVSMDKTKTMFKDCLGTEFPFDVIESVQDYAHKLSNVLNSSLDDVLCNNAVPNFYDTTVNTYNEVKQETSDGIQFVKDYYNDVVGSDDDSVNIENNGAGIDHTITSNDWLKTYTQDDFKNGTLVFESGNLNADRVQISVNGGYDSSSGSTRAWVGVTVSVEKLVRGPNDGKSEKSDGTNAFESVSGSFYYNKSVSITDSKSIIPFESENCDFSGIKGIDLKISFTMSDIPSSGSSSSPNFRMTLGPLNYKSCWSNVSTSLTTEQTGIVDKIKQSVTNEAKQKALQALKSDFMCSSEVNNAMDEQLDALTSSCPALAQVDNRAVRDAMKNTIANNAIALVNGDDFTIDKELTETVTVEVMHSSINYGLQKVGINDDISKSCTRELLNKIVGEFPDATIENPFGSDSDIIDFSSAYNFASGLIGKLNSRFRKLLSSECIKAVNDSFDICSDEMARVTGHTMDLALASGKGEDAAKYATKQFLSGKGL